MLNQNYLSHIERQIEQSSVYNIPENECKRRTIVLDVDNTLICSRYFTDELKIGDKIKFESKNAQILSLTFEVDITTLNSTKKRENMTIIQTVRKNSDIPEKGNVTNYIIEDSDESNNQCNYYIYTFLVLSFFFFFF